MSNLEAKAMSPFEIRKSLNMTWEKGFKTQEEFVAWTKLKEKERWVPLEDAHKEIERCEALRKDAYRVRNGYIETVSNLEAKIEAFKKIAVHVQEHCCDDCEDTSMCDFGCAITELKNALLIPRKENQTEAKTNE